MKKSILEIYALAVCFVTVVCFVVSLGIATYSVLEIVKPEFTVNSSQFSQHQTNDAFWDSCGANRYCGPEAKKKDRPSEADVTKQRNDSYARVLASEQRDGSQVLVKCFIIMLIDLVVFGFHWVVARRARANAA